jgi:hypothetical protein
MNWLNFSSLLSYYFISLLSLLVFILILSLLYIDITGALGGGLFFHKIKYAANKIL